jgi:hypothetical protein
MSDDINTPQVAAGNTNDASAYVNTDPLFVVIKDRPRPDIDPSRRSIYPFGDMMIDTCFYAGNVIQTEKLVGRLNTAIYNRKKKHPTERYGFEQMDNGDRYVWRLA